MQQQWQQRQRQRQRRQQHQHLFTWLGSAALGWLKMSSYHLPTWFPWSFPKQQRRPLTPAEHRRNNVPRGSPGRNLRWTPDMAGHVFRQRCWMTLAQVVPFVLGEPRRVGVTVTSFWNVEMPHNSGEHPWKATVYIAIIQTLHNPAAKEPSEKGSPSSSPHVSGVLTSCKQGIVRNQVRGPKGVCHLPLPGVWVQQRRLHMVC